jgi:hypothetical protein
MSRNSLGRGVTALALAFSTTAFAGQQQDIRPEKPDVDTISPHAEPGHRYYKDGTGSIVDVWNCVDSYTSKPTLCIVGHAINYDNGAVWKEAAEKLEMKQQSLTREHLDRFCGFGARHDVAKDKDGKYKGKLWVALDWVRMNGNGYKEGRTFGIEIEEKETSMHIDGWLSGFRWTRLGKSAHFTRVPDAEVPKACEPPPIADPTGKNPPPSFIKVTPYAALSLLK